MTLGLLKAIATAYVVAMAMAFFSAELAQQVFPIAQHDTPPTGYLALAVAGCFLGSVLAAYVAARLAPDARAFQALVLLVLTFAATAAVIARLAPELIKPKVVLPLTTMLMVIGAVAGAMIERAIYGETRSRGPSATS
jgi:hypothetical protein